MSATATAQLVSAPARATIYLSRRRELRLVKTPKYPIFGQAGSKVGELPGETIPFHDGRLDVPQDGVMVLEDGRKVEASEVREWLEDHRLFGDQEGGFWELEQVGPPVSKAEMDAILDAVGAWDVEKLEAIIEQESDGWQRQDLLASAREHLDKIRAARGRQDEVLEAEVQRRMEEAAKKPAAKQAPKAE